MNNVIEHPIMTEKAMDLMEEENTLQYIVALDAAKPEIEAAIEEQFDITLDSVNTMVTPQGTKKATVRLSEADDAEEVISRIGVF